MMFLLIIVSSLAFADSPGRWEFARAIVDRHEFYKDGEEITKPSNSWQALFAVSYLDSTFRHMKDCLFYRVPGDESGKIKIKAMAADKDCTSEILAAGDVEMENVSKLRFSTTDTSAMVDFVKETKAESWKIFAVKEWKKPEPKLLLSSADFKSPGIIYLAPAQEKSFQLNTLPDKTLCHDINQECQEVSSSRCDQCEKGWIEIPSGCVKGPKICGSAACGSKDQPACRRGMIWQRKEMDFDCRTDASFAWCSKGLSVNCDGDRAYCR